MIKLAKEVGGTWFTLMASDGTSIELNDGNARALLKDLQWLLEGVREDELRNEVRHLRRSNAMYRRAAEKRAKKGGAR